MKKNKLIGSEIDRGLNEIQIPLNFPKKIRPEKKGILFYLSNATKYLVIKILEKI